MRKATLLVLSLVLLLSVLTLSASAETIAIADGDNLWEYLPFTKVIDESGRCVTPEIDFSVDPPVQTDTRPPCIRLQKFGKTYFPFFDVGKWSGAFNGTTTEHGSVLIDEDGMKYYGKMQFEGSVHGAFGTMEIIAFGLMPAGEPEGSGNWMIVPGSGTGGLEGVSGGGTWWGPGWLGDPMVYGQIWYEGEVNFDV